MDSIRQGGLALLQRIERFFDAFFGAAGNPWRHLGALGFHFLWIALATGIYLFIVLDTGIEDVHASSTSRASSGTSAASCAACTAIPPTAWCW